MRADVRVSWTIPFRMSGPVRVQVWDDVSHTVLLRPRPGAERTSVAIPCVAETLGPGALRDVLIPGAKLPFFNGPHPVGVLEVCLGASTSDF